MERRGQKEQENEGITELQPDEVSVVLGSSVEEATVDDELAVDMEDSSLDSSYSPQVINRKR
jgi:hypothetical protein